MLLCNSQGNNVGFQLIADEDLVIPDKTKAIFDGAIQASGWSSARTDSIFRMYFEALAKKYRAQRVVAELNGMQLVGDLYSRFPEEWAVAQEVMFADSTTIMAYNANMRNLVMDKLVGAQMVVFNRLEKGADIMPFHKLARALNRRIDIIYIEAVLRVDTRGHVHIFIFLRLCKTFPEVFGVCCDVDYRADLLREQLIEQGGRATLVFIEPRVKIMRVRIEKFHIISLFKSRGDRSPLFYYLILSPRGVSLSRKITLTCSSPLAKIIPFDSIEQRVAGLRLQTSTIFLPISASGS